MTGLSELTDKSKVQEVIDDVLKPGSRLLEGFTSSSDYFILTPSGRLLDSKPVLALAYERQLGRRLPVGSFRGGVSSVRKLTDLGFEVVTRAVHNPPKIGDQYPNRTAVKEAFGGDKVGGIIRFPGDHTVNVFSDATGPYADELPNQAQNFGYRGAGLQGDQTLESAGNRRLEEARQRAEGVRFWHKPIGQPFTFLMWVAVVDRSWVRGRDQSGADRLEIEWVLQPVNSPNKTDWPSSVMQSVAEASQVVGDEPEALEREQSPSYRDLFEGVASREAPGSQTRVRQDHARSRRAREAVLVRAAGHCEGPDCTGVPAEPNRRGEPILDVDHIVDLALGGSDNPLNMVALCPNCHAVKTRGRRSLARTKRLLAVVRDAHDVAIKIPGDQLVG